MINNWWLKVKHRRITYSKDMDVVDVLYQYLQLIDMYSLDKVTYKQRVENSYLSLTDTAGDFIKLTHLITGQVSRRISHLNNIVALKEPLQKTNFDIWLTTADGDINEGDFVKIAIPHIKKLTDLLLTYRSEDDSFYIYVKKTLDLYFKMIITICDILIRLQTGDTTDVPRHLHDLILRR